MDESVPTIFSPFVQQKKSATTRIILGHDIHTHHNHFRIQDQACWFKTSLIQCCWKVLYPFEITKYFHSFRPDSLPSIIFKADQRCSEESKIRFHSLMSDTLFYYSPCRFQRNLGNSPTIKTREQYFLLR